MSFDVDIDITGVGDAIRRIQAYSLQLSDKIVGLALRSGAAIIKSSIQSEAPVLTGRLKRSIKVFNSKINRRNRNSKIGLFIRPKSGRSRTDRNGAYYAFMAENGFEVRGTSGGQRLRRTGSTGLISGRKTAASGKFVNGQLFIREGYNKSKVNALNAITQSIEAGSRQLAQRLEL